MALFGKKTGDSGEMSFLDHLEVLRWHLVRSAIAIILFAVIAFANPEILFDKIIFGCRNADFFTYKVMCWLAAHTGLDLCYTPPYYKLINTEMAGPFTTHIYISIVTGIIVAFPYIFYELWRFIKPALKDNELKMARGIVLYTSLLFFMGVAFGYFIVSPFSANFLATYKPSAQIESYIDFNSFISLVTITTLLSGLIFELPLISYILTRIGVLTPTFLRQYRKHAAVVLMVAAALITPSPDISSMLVVFVPLYVLYEVSIVISSRTHKKRQAQAV